MCVDLNVDAPFFLLRLIIIMMMLYIPTIIGRTIRIDVFDQSRVSEFLTNAAAAAFDWVSYENSAYVCLSVMPDSK